jgi:hypothetical protein
MSEGKFSEIVKVFIASIMLIVLFGAAFVGINGFILAAVTDRIITMPPPVVDANNTLSYVDAVPENYPSPVIAVVEPAYENVIFNNIKALSAEQVQKLVAEKALPAEDPHVKPCGLPWGWAVTGLVLSGEKGKAKRFAYRYYLNPRRPIMDWEDPQAGARRILSACAIRRIGTQGAALLGMQTRSLQGLNPGARLEASLEPALSAAVSISREVRRYGAWTWLEDELSLPQLHAFLRQGPDFAFDSVSSPGAEHALLTGNAELVRFMYDEARRTGLEQRRLVRRLPDERGLSYALPHLCALENANSSLSPARIQEQAQLSRGAWAGSTLYAGSTGLAALALNTNSSNPTAKATIRQGQTLLLFFKAMQPGLFMLPARELLGALPLDGK